MADVDFYTAENGMTFSWTAVVGAAGYDLEIDRPVADDGAFPPVTWPIVLRGEETERYVARLPITYSNPAHYSRYPWRVRAVNVAGQPGAYSEPFRFVVVEFLPTPTPPQVADVDDDGVINHLDLFQMAEQWRRLVPGGDFRLVRMDLERDGRIDGEDVVRYVEGHRARRETEVPVPVLVAPSPEETFSRSEFLSALTLGIPFFVWDSAGEAFTYDLELEGFTPYPESNGPFYEYGLRGEPVEDGGVTRWGVPPTRSLREGRYRVRLRARSPLGRASPFGEWVFFTITEL